MIQLKLLQICYIRMGQCIANDMKEPVSKEVIKQVLPFII
uniref:Uncharacterized protein n=1 Tax=viral metagenome TaxID=1070528 RepID=A0A6C0H283_9ZZZZ